MRRLRRLGAAALSAGALVTPLHAQVAPAPVAVARADSAGRSPAPRWQIEQCMGGVTYGAPLKMALAYGMGVVRETENLDLCFLGVAKVGFGGASFSLGVANTLGRFGSGSAVSVGLLRTFADPRGALPRRTYAGASLHVWPVLVLGGEIGYYLPLGADADGAPASKGIVTWSAGFGF